MSDTRDVIVSAGIVGTIALLAIIAGNAVEETSRAINEPARLQAAGELVIKSAQARQMDAVTRALEIQTNMLVLYQMLGISIGFLLLIILLAFLCALFRAYKELQHKEQMIAILKNMQIAEAQ